MTPNKHYEVLSAVEINGTLYDVGAVVELAEADAQPFVDAGQLKEHGEGSAPASDSTQATPDAGGTGVAPHASEGATPATEPAAPAPSAASTDGGEAPAPEAPKAEEKKGWVGGHTVGGNDQVKPGGGLRESGLTPPKEA